MTFRSHAQALVQYYARLVEEQSTDAEWATGLRLAEKWLALIEAPDLEPSKVSDFVKEVELVERRGNVGTGIVDLSLSVHAWASSR